MSYLLYLGGKQMPVMPKSIIIRNSMGNETLRLLDGEEVLRMRSAGLRTVQFTVLLPQKDQAGGEGAEEYLTYFGSLQKNRLPVYFTLFRRSYGGTPLFTTVIPVVLSELTITEDAANGLDISATLFLTEYAGVQTRKNGQAQGTAVPIAGYTENNLPQDRYRIAVQGGDSLISIARKVYGDSSRWGELYNANASRISLSSQLTAGTVLTVADD